jgi:hypothetical protein
MNWAADTGRLLAELTAQLTRAKISRNQSQQSRILDVTSDIGDPR